MKIEIEIPDEVAALLVANRWNERTPKEICELLAQTDAESYARAFPESARKITAEIHAKRLGASIQ